MDRRDFCKTFAASLTATFAGAVPLIHHGDCTFCGREYPEAAWILESPDRTRRLCDHCAEALESVLQHLGRGEDAAALTLLREQFPDSVRISGVPASLPVLDRSLAGRTYLVCV